MDCLAWGNFVKSIPKMGSTTTTLRDHPVADKRTETLIVRPVDTYMTQDATTRTRYPTKLDRSANDRVQTAKKRPG